MNSEQQAAIERLRELEAKATQGNWYKDEEFEQSLTALCRAENRKDILFGACDWEDADFIVALRNEALPLLIALAAENERLRSERDEIEAELNEELDGKFNFIADCEFAIEKIGKERDALEARIDGALGVLNIALPEDCDSDVWMTELEKSQEKAIKILKGEQNV